MQPATESPERAEQPGRSEGAEPGTVARARATATPSPNAPKLSVPRTAAELSELRNRRDDLVGQLVATHSRRGERQEEMRQTDAGGQGVLRQQMSELDQRVLRMEQDVSTLDHLIATAPAAFGVQAGALDAVQLAQQLAQPSGFVVLGPNGPSANAVPALLLLITLLQIVLLIRSRMRRTPPVAADAVTRESAARLARVEQAVDAIAVEVERVSEGQRFVSRLLSERPPAPASPPAPPPRQYATPS